MCLILLAWQTHPDYPLAVCANRDEFHARPTLAADFWSDQPGILAGRDLQAGGTWLGMNDHGVVAGILNRKDSLGPDPRLRSRGEIVLEALDHADAVEAAHALAELDGRAYRSFNMIVADNRDAWWLRSLGEAGGGRVEVKELPPGLSMITSRELDDPESPRIRLYRPRFAVAPPPDPPGRRPTTTDEISPRRQQGLSCWLSQSCTRRADNSDRGC